nr:hypothetical protein [Paenibacillus sp. FJAT-27812]
MSVSFALMVSNLHALAQSIGDAGSKIDSNAKEIDSENQILTEIVSQISIATMSWLKAIRWFPGIC